jgi:hypothetical protein
LIEPASVLKETLRFGVNGLHIAGLCRIVSLLLLRHSSSFFSYFCFRRSKADVQISHVLGRALQLHPRYVQFWIDAASWEFEVNGNSSAARVLLQRGIRFNPDSQVLWKEYFRLEVLYCVKLQQRRRVLSANSVVDEEKRSNSLIDAPEASGPNSLSFEVDGSFEVLLQGAVPKAVLKHCATAIVPSSFPSFASEELLPLLAPLEPSVRSMLQDHVLALIDSISPSSLHSAVFRLRRLICVENVGFDDVKAGQEFEKHVVAVSTNNCDCVIKLIDVWLAALDLCSNDAVAARIAKHCVRRLEQSTASSPLEESLWLHRLHTLMKMNMSKAAVLAAHAATKALPLSLSLWQLRFSIISSSSDAPIALAELAATVGRTSHLTKLLVLQMRENESKLFGTKCTEETAATLQSLAIQFAAGSRDESFVECSGAIFDAAMWCVAACSSKPVDTIFGCAVNLNDVICQLFIHYFQVNPERVALSNAKCVCLYIARIRSSKSSSSRMCG